jgi:hypothetical protein
LTPIGALGVTGTQFDSKSKVEMIDLQEIGDLARSESFAADEIRSTTSFPGAM